MCLSMHTLERVPLHVSQHAFPSMCVPCAHLQLVWPVCIHGAEVGALHGDVLVSVQDAAVTRDVLGGVDVVTYGRMGAWVHGRSGHRGARARQGRMGGVAQRGRD